MICNTGRVECTKALFNSHQIDAARDSHSIFLDFQIAQSQPPADLKHNKADRYKYSFYYADIEIHKKKTCKTFVLFPHQTACPSPPGSSFV